VSAETSPGTGADPGAGQDATVADPTAIADPAAVADPSAIDQPAAVDDPTRSVLAALAPYRAAGVLDDADVHLAATLARLGRDPDPVVALAVALAARAPRHGHVCIELSRVAALVTAELEPDPIPASFVDDADVPVGMVDLHWPDPAAWTAAVAASPLVTGPAAPLVLERGRLYLERYHRLEQLLAELVRDRLPSTDGAEPDTVELDPDGPAVALLRGDGADRQRAAVAHALGHRLTVLVGGPGTGKTTTVAALLAEVLEREPSTRVALAAPTGKAAARLADAVREAAGRLDPDLAARLGHLQATTIHRLLGSRADRRSAFRHDRHDPLVHDLVVVDETSMVSLPLLSRLLDAVRPEARVVLVGDPDQLASVEAGAALADLVRPDTATTAAVVALEVSRRFDAGSSIGTLARAVRAGDVDAALAALGDGGAVRWLPYAATDPSAAAAVRELVVPAAVEVIEAARAGDADTALAGIDRIHLLCAHRHGPYGVERWNDRIEGWLRDLGVVRPVGWYPGRPVLVTANDHRSGLFNGDLGVTVPVPDRGPAVVFPTAGGLRWVPAGRLDHVETVHATTIHKSQGSEFDHVVVVLPPAASALASRELLYTAVTRARTAVTVVGDVASVRAAVGHRVERISGLADRLR
jgi:exodeoxyribonuclease V alpha subunit